MRKRGRVIALLAVVAFFNLLWFLSPRVPLVREPSNQTIGGIPTTATDTQEVRIIKYNAGGGEYSRDGSKIVFHRKGDDGYYDLYTADSKGLNESCLTCNSPLFAGKSAGNGSWYPNGDFIVFQAGKDRYFHHPGSKALTHPGIGWYNDIWITTARGDNFWQITDLPTKRNLLDKTPLEAVLGGHFSPDGKKVSWSQTTNNKFSGWDGWEIIIGDFYVADGVPSVINLLSYRPREINGYYESDDFNLIGDELLISANLELGQKAIGMDIYRYNLSTKNLDRLTTSLLEWDEAAMYSPDYRKIVWLSSTGYAFNAGTTSGTWWEDGRADYWLMSADGTDKRQITFFNKEGTADSRFVGGHRVIPAYADWHPSGDGLLLSIVVEESRGNLVDQLVELDLGGL